MQTGHEQDNPHERVDPYAGGDSPMWSGEPNAALVSEVDGLAPGRALDIGAGEGADAVWLAGRGWQVTGLEPSATALARARSAARETGVEVTWVEATLEDAELPSHGFDLVSCCYPALRRTADQRVEHAISQLVAPGGMFVLLTHADVDRERALAHGFDPDDYLDHGAIRDSLGPEWSVVVDERRDRHVSGGGGAHHTADLVLVARKS